MLTLVILVILMLTLLSMHNTQYDSTGIAMDYIRFFKAFTFSLLDFVNMNM